MPAKINKAKVRKSARGRSTHPTIKKLAKGFTEGFDGVEAGDTDEEGNPLDILGFTAAEVKTLQGVKGNAAMKLAAAVSDALGRKVAAGDRVEGGPALTFTRQNKKSGPEKVQYTSLHLQRENKKKDSGES